MTNGEITEKIIFYSERLESLVYYEDKEECLNFLYSICPEHAVKVGVYCLTGIIKSMEMTKDVTLQTKLLIAILSTEHKDEFIDIIMKEEKNIHILFSHPISCKYLCKQITTKKGYETYKILKNANMLIQCIDQLPYSLEYVRHLINEESIQFFVFNGLFEQLLAIVDSHNWNYCTTTIEKMLNSSLQAQNYFMELKWKNSLKDYNFNKICFALLDKRNEKFGSVQKYIIKEDLLDVTDLIFVHHFIYNSVEAFVYAEKKGLKLEDILKSVYNIETTDVACNLFARYALYRDVLLSDLEEAKEQFFTLLCILILVNDNISDEPILTYVESAQFMIFEYKTINPQCLISLLVFMIVVEKATLDIMIVKEMLNDRELSTEYKCLLSLAISHKKVDFNQVSLNREVLYDQLILLRQKLVNHEIKMADVVREHLLELTGLNICSLQNKVSYKKEYYEYMENITRHEAKRLDTIKVENKPTPKSVDKSEQSENTNQISKYKSTFKSIFSANEDKQKSDNDTIFDL